MPPKKEYGQCAVCKCYLWKKTTFHAACGIIFGRIVRANPGLSFQKHVDLTLETKQRLSLNVKSDVGSKAKHLVLRLNEISKV